MKNRSWILLPVAAPGLALGLAMGLALTACGKPPPAPAALSPTEAPPSTTAAATAGDAPAPAPAPAPRNVSPVGAAVSIISPHDGDVVSSPVKVVFGLQGMILAPAGDPTPMSGHHHLLVDVPAPDLGQPIPKDDHHLHFGKAQTEVELTLTPGQHTLQLLFGDSNHVPQNPPLISAPITITVK